MFVITTPSQWGTMFLIKGKGQHMDGKTTFLKAEATLTQEKAESFTTVEEATAFAQWAQQWFVGDLTVVEI